MKKTILLSIALVALGFGSTRAADLPVRQPYVKAPPMALFSWAGWYIGGHVGGGWSRNTWSGLDDGGVVTILDTNYPASFSFNDSGLVGGGHAGVQGQWGNFVLGVETAGTVTNLKATTTGVSTTVGTDDVLTSRVQWLFTVVGRAGIAFDRVLIYGKGGYAGGDVRTSISDTVGPITGTWSNTQWHNGWTAGGGLEYALTNNWIVGVEGNYYRLNRELHSALDSGGQGPIFTNASVKITSVLARLSYKFGGPVY